MAKILVVDDDRSLRDVVTFILEEAGHAVIGAGNGDEGVARYDADEPDLVLTDMKMPGRDGLEVLGHVQRSERAEQVPVIVLTAYGTIEQAVAAMKSGAYSYLLKPFNRDELTLTIAQALHAKGLESDNATLRRQLRDRSSSLSLVHVSERMRRLVEQIRNVAATDAAVLVTGESGTGKELVARALHDLSPRWDRSFVAVNCGAIPAELLESELFGHARGAFTGAGTSTPGRIRGADRGTLFLDEIAELPVALQPKLLRVLETKTVDPVGDSRSFTVDFRLVSASNRDLGQAMARGGFREDLYYRIETVHLHVPPLRERREDIPALWSHFTTLHGGGGSAPSAGLLRRLQAMEWPGNVRELKNMNQRLLALGGGGRLTERDLDAAVELMGPPPSGGGAATPRRDEAPAGEGLLPGPLPEDGLSLPELEKEVVRRALAKFGGNKSRAARYLGVPRHVLIYRLRKYGLDRG